MNGIPTGPSDLPPVLPPQPAPADPVNRRRWWIHLVLITTYILAVGIIGKVRGETHGPALSHTPRGLLIVSGVELAIFGLVFGLAILVSRASRDDLWLHWRGGFWPVPLGIGYSIAIRLMIFTVVIAVSLGLLATQMMTPQTLREFFYDNRPTVEAIVDVSAMRQDPVYFWLVLTVVSFGVAGLREELWRSAFLGGLRKLWPQYFGTRTGQVIAVLIASMIFGFAHLRMGLLAAVMAGLIGLGLGLVMVWHRSIWPAVVAHGMFDATSLAGLPWLAERLHGFQINGP